MSETDYEPEFDREQTVKCRHCGRRFQMSVEDMSAIDSMYLLCTRCMGAGFGFGELEDPVEVNWFE